MAVLVIEAVLANGLVGPKISHVVFLFVAVLGLALIFRFPMAATLGLIFLTDFIFYPTQFAVPVSSIEARPHEFALVALLLLAIVRPVRKSWGGVAGAALLVFFGFVLLSAAAAVLADRVSFREAVNTTRPFALFAIFWIVIRLFPSPKDWRVLLTGTAVIAAVAGVASAMVALGAGFGHSLEAPGGQTIRAEEGIGSLERVRLAGLAAGYALYWFTIVQIAMRKGRERLGWGLVLVGITLAVIVSFNRNMWLGICLGFVLMMIAGGSLVRRWLTGSIAVLCGAAILFLVFGTASTNQHVVAPIIKRGETILNPGKTVQEGSLQDRASETEVAWRTARRHLLLGVGAGAPFGVINTKEVGGEATSSNLEQQQQLFLHNQYLYLILISGIPGLLAFVVFLLTPIRYAFARRPRDPAIVACGVGIALIALSSFVAIYLTSEDMITVIGLLAGVIVADKERHLEEPDAPGLAS